MRAEVSGLLVWSAQPAPVIQTKEYDAVTLSEVIHQQLVRCRRGGRYVFPLAARSKRPVVCWKDEATTSRPKIEAWLKRYGHEGGWAISCGRVACL